VIQEGAAVGRVEEIVAQCVSLRESEAESEKQSGRNQTMSRKYTVPYALYRMHGYVNGHLAEQTGFSQADLELLWEALINGFEHSAGRGLMSAQQLIVFEHRSAPVVAAIFRLFP